MPNLQTLYNGVRFPVDGPCIANVRRLDYGALPMIDSMHQNGVLIDTGKLEEVSALLSQQMDTAYADIINEVGKANAINPRSPNDVANLLFSRLHVQQREDKLRYTDAGNISTDADQLKYYEDAHPVVGHILRYRQAATLRSTFASKLPRMVDASGRLHTTFTATRASTGRLASRNPNLQNIPARSDEGRRIRESFIAADGRKLVGRDLSQIEMRGAAHYANEPSWVKGFQDPDFDVHNANTIDMWGFTPAHLLKLGGVDSEEFKLKYRLPTKNLGFGVLYRMGPQGLQAAWVKFGVGYKPLDYCEEFIERFYAARPAIRKWQDLQIRRARQYGMVWDLFGRVRLIPHNKSVLGWVRSEGEREAANMPIQSLAQGILKLAMAELQDYIDDVNRGETKVWPLLQIHDELIFEVVDDFVEEFNGMCEYVMENVCELLVPISSSGAVMECWSK